MSIRLAFSIVGNDATICMAAEACQLQLNAFEPIIVHRLLESVSWLQRGFEGLGTLCIHGIEIDVEHLALSSTRSVGVVTALTPYIGYAVAAAIAKQALAGQGTIRDLALAGGSIAIETLDDALRPERLASNQPEI